MVAFIDILLLVYSLLDLQSFLVHEHEVSLASTQKFVKDDPTFD